MTDNDIKFHNNRLFAELQKILYVYGMQQSLLDLLKEEIPRHIKYSSGTLLFNNAADSKFGMLVLASRYWTPVFDTCVLDMHLHDILLVLHKIRLAQPCKKSHYYEDAYDFYPEIAHLIDLTLEDWFKNPESLIKTNQSQIKTTHADIVINFKYAPIPVTKKDELDELLKILNGIKKENRGAALREDQKEEIKKKISEILSQRHTEREKCIRDKTNFPEKDYYLTYFGYSEPGKTLLAQTSESVCII